MKLHRKTLVTNIVLAAVAILLMLGGLYAFRFTLWREYPTLRAVLRPVLLADPSLRRATKAEVLDLLGEADIVEERYCWFPRDLDKMTGDLRFEIGDSNQIRRVHFIWRDWVPKATRTMDLTNWKYQDEPTKWEMNADLVRRWPDGDFQGHLDTVDDVLKSFPGYLFIDYLQFASDGSDGLGGSLDFEFEPDGSIRKIRTGYID